MVGELGGDGTGNKSEEKARERGLDPKTFGYESKHTNEK